MEVSAYFISPSIQQLVDQDFKQFLGFVDGSVSLAVDKDIQFVYGLKNLLKDMSADENNEEYKKIEVLERVQSVLQAKLKLAGESKLNEIVEITTNALSYFSRSFFKLPKVTKHKEELREYLHKTLGIPQSDHNKPVEENLSPIAIDY